MGSQIKYSECNQKKDRSLQLLYGASYSWHFHRKCNFCSWLLWLTRGDNYQSWSISFPPHTARNNRIGCEARRWAGCRDQRKWGTPSWWMQRLWQPGSNNCDNTNNNNNNTGTRRRERRKHFCFWKIINTFHTRFFDKWWWRKCNAFVLCVICILFLGSVVVCAAANERDSS